MSHFYGIIKGAPKLNKTARGHATTGLTTWCNGWNIGIQCDAYVDDEGNDSIRVIATSGSSSKPESYTIGTVLRNKKGVIVFIPIK